MVEMPGCVPDRLWILPPTHLQISAIPLQKACQISALYFSQLTLDGVCAAHASVDSTE